MEWAIGSVLEKYLNGRKLAVYGTGPLSYNISGIVSKYSPIDCYISKDAKNMPVFRNKPVYEFAEFLGDTVLKTKNYVNGGGYL